MTCQVLCSSFWTNASSLSCEWSKWATGRGAFVFSFISLLFQWASIIFLIYILLSITSNGSQSECKWGWAGGDAEGGAAAGANAAYGIPTPAGVQVCSYDIRRAPPVAGQLEMFVFVVQLLWLRVKRFPMNVRKKHYQTSASRYVLGEWPAALWWPSTWLEWPSARERERNLCGETAKRSVWRRTGATVWEGDGRMDVFLFLLLGFNVTLPVFSSVKSTRWGWWWTSAGTTEDTPSSPSVTNRRPKQRWSSSTTTRSGNAKD